MVSRPSGRPRSLPLAFNLPITRGYLAVVALIQLDQANRGSVRQLPGKARAISTALCWQCRSRNRASMLGSRSPVERLENRHPRHTGDIADDVLQFKIPLHQSLPPMLEMLAGIRDQHTARAQVAPQHTNLLGRAKGRS